MPQSSVTSSVNLIPSPGWPALSVKMTPLKSLIFREHNARIHSKAQVAEIAAAISEWGWTMPILAGEDGVIIAGHGRAMAAAVLGLDAVPVITADGWSEGQIRAYAIADNKLALNADWNEDLLRAEIQALQVLEFDVGSAGFTEEELIELLRGGDFDPDPDDPPPLDKLNEVIVNCPACGHEFDCKARQ